MLFLLFHVGDNQYAIETSRVTEVIPMVLLKKIHNAPNFMSGFFNYRGLVIPVVDFSHLIKGEPSQFYLSTRIIILKYPDLENRVRHLGLIAEQVTETLDKAISELIDPDMNLDRSTYLSKMMIDRDEIIQCINLVDLLADSEQLFLLSGAIE